jgi:bla regulator protein blaR1
MIPNHLWQSTVVAGVAALLAFVLRKTHARTRYWLWLAASLKFLIPFSLLVAVGKQIEWSAATPGVRKLSVVVEQISQPFALEQPVAAIQPALAHGGSFLPAILLTIWICGFAAIAILWWRRWRRIHTAVHRGAPLPLKLDVPVRSSPALLEPGVFGIFRPVLLLPEGITGHLTAAQLEAVIAHEMCHVRRRDNLTAAIHMAVEAIFWFHPLVWWLGARLVEERELACDEEVLRLGNEPQIYAESILKTCQFYLESPLACVSGITGSDLKRRIVRIMTRGLEKKLDFWRKLLLVAAGAAALTGPIVLGLMNAPQSRAQSQPAASTPAPSFEVASIKVNHSADRRAMIRFAPGGRFTANNVALKGLLEQAYRVKDSQLVGAPNWIETEHYDIDAKMDDATVDAMKKLDGDQRREQYSLILRALFVDRFKLRVRHETRDLPVYVLLVGKNGPKFHETALTAAELAPPNPKGPMIRMMGRGQLNVTAAGLDIFADVLSQNVGRVVLDKTGLKAKYDFTLQWTPDDSTDQMVKAAGAGPDGKPPLDAPPPDASGPSIFAAVQEQLGLKLEAQKSPLDVLVIDHIEKPSEN